MPQEFLNIIPVLLCFVVFEVATVRHFADVAPFLRLPFGFVLLIREFGSLSFLPRNTLSIAPMDFQPIIVFTNHTAFYACVVFAHLRFGVGPDVFDRIELLAIFFAERS